MANIRFLARLDSLINYKTLNRWQLAIGNLLLPGISGDEVPDTSGLHAIDGIADVTIDEATLRIDCSDPAVKTDEISYIEQAGASRRNAHYEPMLSVLSCKQGVAASRETHETEIRPRVKSEKPN